MRGFFRNKINVLTNREKMKRVALLGFRLYFAVKRQRMLERKYFNENLNLTKSNVQVDFCHNSTVTRKKIKGFRQKIRRNGIILDDKD